MLKISLEQAQELLSYLQHRPYVEVFELINNLMSLDKIEDEEESK